MKSFRVYGLPEPQGSTRSFVVAGRAVTTSANKSLKPWRDNVTRCALDARDGDETLLGPIDLLAFFYSPKPASATKRVLWKITRPDVDKLTRALCDSLTVAGLFRDDSQVVHLDIWKLFATTSEPPGVYVVVDEITESPLLKKGLADEDHGPLRRSPSEDV